MKDMTTGQRIASRRKLANLSQEDISQELQVSRQAVSKWESDGGLPDIDNLIKLSRIFGVSVGWLLGTEADPSFDPSTGLSDAQLKMVEEILARNRPRSPKGWIAGAVAVCVLALAVFGVFFQGKLNGLSEENAAAQSQIAALEQSNQALIAQMDAMNAALSQQAKEEDLLLNVYLKAYLDGDGETVVLDFYFVPKLYQESAQAHLIVWNEAQGMFETVSCEPMGNWYHCRTELPVCNGYRYSFLLAAEGSYQEQALDDVSFVSYFNDLYDATRYHLDGSAQPRSVWYLGDREYSFTQPIGSPLIDFRSAYVGYEEVDLTLSLNGAPIHTQSLREELKAYGGAHMRFEEPYTPDFRCALPELEAGDVLTLTITSQNYSGQTMAGTLETLVVTE